MKIEEIKKGIKNIKEPRRTGYGNFRHKLEDIIIIGFCTVICGGEDFADMEAFGKSRQEYLGKFLELPNGIPDSDTFRRVFEKLDPSEPIVMPDRLGGSRKSGAWRGCNRRQNNIVHLLQKISLRWVN